MELLTPRLSLRELTPDDAPAIVAISHDPEVMRHLPRPPGASVTKEAVQAGLARAEVRPRRTRYELAVELRDTGDFLGWVQLFVGVPDDAAAEAGWTLARAAWGRGYGTEAAGALLTFGFETLDLAYVWARCRPENAASRCLMEKIGMRPAAPLPPGAGRTGDLHYSIYSRDWWAARREDV